MAFSGVVGETIWLSPAGCTQAPTIFEIGSLDVSSEAEHMAVSPEV